MTLNTAIKRAIELAIKKGEYLPHFPRRGRFIVIDAEDDGIVISNDYTTSPVMKREEIFMSPQFWQCLGVAMGWDREVDDNCCEICGEMLPLNERMFRYHGSSGNCPKPPLGRREWKKEWHRFIDALASGKTAEEAMGEILK